jgi:actin-related protein 8
MMLADQFPYADINLKRRYDWLLAEELKERFVSLKGEDVTQQMYDFHLRADGQDTRKYLFKTFDEQMLAPLAFWYPGVMDHAYKLEKRHTVVDRSYDLYDGSPNDPYSIAQSAAQAWTSQYLPATIVIEPEVAPTVQVLATPSKPKPFNLLSRLQQDDNELTPRSSAANSPAPEGADTPKRAESPGAGDAANTGNGGPVAPPVDRLTELHRVAEQRSRVLPLMPLDHAIYTSILQSSRASEPRMKEFFSQITIVGGGSKIPGFTKFLEEKLREMVPGLVSEVEGKTVGVPGVVEAGSCGWKGAAVFGRLSGSGNDSWVWSGEYDLLGSKLLAQKCMWNW